MSESPLIGEMDIVSRLQAGENLIRLGLENINELICHEIVKSDDGQNVVEQIRLLQGWCASAEAYISESSPAKEAAALITSLRAERDAAIAARNGAQSLLVSAQCEPTKQHLEMKARAELAEAALAKAKAEAADKAAKIVTYYFGDEAENCAAAIRALHTPSGGEE